MPITASCPKCQKEYRVKDDFAGKKFRCKACQGVVTVPDAAADSGGHKDPWDDLDLGAFGDDPDAETGDEAPLPRRTKKKSSKRRGRSGGIPVTVIVALICESILVLFSAALLVFSLVSLEICFGFVNLIFLVIRGGAVFGYVKGINVIRWISIVLCGIGMLFFLSCSGVLGLGGMAALQEQGNLPQEQIAMIQGMFGIVIAGMIALVLFYGTIMGCLLTGSARDHFQN